MQINIQGLLSHSAELAARLQLLPSVDVVCLNETWLDQSVSYVNIPGFACVARRDRVGQKCGGVATYARTEILQSVVFIANSETCERQWLLVHSDQGPYVLANWYRPPSDSTDSIASFLEEFRKFSPQALGVVCVGDLNVHHRSWLKYSNRESPEGQRLKDICGEANLKQFVREPTRGDYLLDLVLSDQDNIQVEVLPMVADHKLVLTSLVFKVPEMTTRLRTVWQYKDADWERLRAELLEQDWSTLLHAENTANGVESVSGRILELAHRSIPQRSIHEQKSSHEWLSADTIAKVKRKQDAEGTADEQKAARECSESILEGFQGYVQRSRKQLQSLQQGSKVWWRLARKLALQAGPMSSIPALRGDDGSWATQSEAKANLLLKTFTAKFHVPSLVLNRFSELISRQPLDIPVLEITEDLAYKHLSSLRVDSATGPDLLPAKILKIAAEELALPVAMVAQYILDTGNWPECWQLHWIIALHKKLSVFQPKHYRGVHLTPHLAKVVERIFADVLQPFLTRGRFFGANQFAYTAERGARDAVAYLIMSWIWAMERRKRVAVFCSDVQGAFDRVSRERLCAKLASLGIPEKLVAVLASWLLPRRAYVLVEGATSAEANLRDMVFQGTVLGPLLWNIFFADARDPIVEVGFQEIVYADDLNAFKEFDSQCTSEEILKECDKCQHGLHAWGAANGATFDPGKESAQILSRQEPFGKPFKILGIEFDLQLRMDLCIDATAKSASWKLQVLLRTKRFHTDAELLLLYKAQILSFIEYRTPAVYHACATHLDSIDAVQKRLLKALDMSPERAIVDFRLAPLSSRRDIAMLGIIHRSVLGKGPDHFRQFFRPKVAQQEARTRREKRRHRFQLEDPQDSGRYTEFLRRSIFGLIGVYNLLPARVVEEASVSGFQSALQGMLIEQAQAGEEGWDKLLSPRHFLYNHPISRVV